MVEARWRGHPVLGALVRAAAYLVPMVASVVVGAVVSRLLPPASGTGEAIGWWAVVLASSGVTVLGVQRLARRLLPIGVLLSLSLVFPDQAPSRFRVAVRAGGTRSLEERIAAARAGHPGATPAEAAQAILELATMLSTHDRRTRGHCERVRVFADLLGEELQLPPGDRDRLRWAALLHDIGKLSVPADILNKDGKPDAEEWAVLQRHPDEAVVFLAPLAAWLGPWTKAATEHHERWDGTGYPRGIARTEIGLAARIVSVADSYEVMTATRAYKKPMSATAARAELAHCAGEQFDPAIVRAFLGISLGRLRLAAGPLSWLAQIPFLGELPRLAGGATSLPNAALIAKTGVATTAMAAGAGAAAVAPVASPAPPAPAAVVEPAADADGEVARDDSTAVADAGTERASTTTVTVTVPDTTVTTAVEVPPVVDVPATAAPTTPSTRPTPTTRPAPAAPAPTAPAPGPPAHSNAGGNGNGNGTPGPPAHSNAGGGGDGTPGPPAHSNAGGGGGNGGGTPGPPAHANGGGGSGNGGGTPGPPAESNGGGGSGGGGSGNGGGTPGPPAHAGAGGNGSGPPAHANPRGNQGGGAVGG